MMSSPFLLNKNREGLPEKIYTDYSVDNDIVEYAEVEKVKMVGKKDTDFIIVTEVVEISRTPRRELINSYRDDVGILNILQKMALSGDQSLLNQTKRIGYGASGEVDSLGRDLEPVVDVTAYQVDRVDALETIKTTKASAKVGLPEELTDGLGFDGLAQLSDDKINAYLENVKKQILAAKEAAKEGDK